MTDLPMHILLVEKNAADVRSIWNMLREKSKFEFTIEAVSELPAAVERITTGGIDVLLLDLALVTPIEETKAIESFVTFAPHLPIVVLTVLQSEHEGLKALEVGAQDYLLKEEMGTRTLVRALRYAIERKQAEIKLYTTEQRLQLSIDGITDYAIVTLDDQGHITDWNVGAEHVFGYHRNDVLGKAVDLLFTPEDQRQHLPQHKLRLAAEAGVADDDRWFVHQDGRLIFASGKLFPLRNKAAQVTGFIKVCRDLTERQLAQEQRDSLLERALEARTEAERANTLKEQLLATISHELRNPLASIVGFASMATSKTMTWPPEALVEFSSVIEEEALKMNGLVEQLIDHARQRTGTLKIDLEATSIPETLGFAMTQIRSITAQHHLVLDVPQTLPDIYADPQRIAQVLNNLVGNAARYSPPQTNIMVTAHTEGQYLQVDVKDEGPGIVPEQRQKVFEPFHQVDRSSTKGIGLGLALCKNLIERHHGQIWVQDHPGPGTIISFTLPIIQDHV